jgi:DNA helicase-2/ATP-dependent DNA helicase PcrA
MRRPSSSSRNCRSTPEILALANASISANVRGNSQGAPCEPRRRARYPAVIGLPASPIRRGSWLSGSSNGTTRGTSSQTSLCSTGAHYQALELQIEADPPRNPVRDPLGTRFFEQRHVKDVLAFLRIVVNPKDELSWKRALKMLSRGSERSASAVWEAIGGRPDPLASFREREGARGIDLPRGAEAALRPFLRLLTRLDSPAVRSSPSEAIRAVVEDVYRDFARAKFPNGNARLDDLEQFALFAQTYDSLPGFLEDVTLFNELSGEDVIAGEPDDDRVVLSSVHQAKGLEWSRVIVMGLSEGRFPSYRSAGTEDGLEEERRLFYVAVTRAKNEVALVYPMLALRSLHGVDVILERSRFLAELPEGVFERWTIELEDEQEITPTDVDPAVN